MRTYHAHSDYPSLLIHSWQRGSLGFAFVSFGVGLTICQPLTPAWSDEVSLVDGCPQLRQQGSASESLSRRFERAKEDARMIEECERWDGLQAIRLDNPDLIWDIDGKMVLMVSWVDNKSPYAHLKPGSVQPVSGQLWATSVPAIRTMLLREVYKTSLGSRNVGASGARPSLDVVRRTKQYLGLPLESQYGSFVEFWVAPQALVRACDDSEVDDRRCQGRPGASVAQAAKPPQAYSNSNFPFTGLGYTYDWGNPVTEVGASEFLVRENNNIRVVRVSTNAEYPSCGIDDSFVSVLRECGK